MGETHASANGFKQVAPAETAWSAHVRMNSQVQLLDGPEPSMEEIEAAGAWKAGLADGLAFTGDEDRDGRA